MVIHNGIDHIKLSQKKLAFNIIKNNNPLHAITLARLDKQKDLATCILAFSN